MVFFLYKSLAMYDKRSKVVLSNVDSGSTRCANECQPLWVKKSASNVLLVG